MSVAGQHGRIVHRAPTNAGEEQAFMQMAVAASIQEARDAGIEVSTNLDALSPAGVRDMQSPFSPFSPPSYTSNSYIGTPAAQFGRYNSSFSGAHSGSGRATVLARFHLYKLSVLPRNNAM
jgi:hypothetical protein